jgi:hypothetical protein
VGKVVVDTLEEAPDDATNWPPASMPKAFHLKPHVADTIKLPHDLFFIEKVHDAVVCT